MSGADDAAPDCEAEPQGDGGGAGEPASSTEGDGKHIFSKFQNVKSQLNRGR